MQRKVIGLFVLGLFALCFVACDDEGDEKSAEQYCNEGCDKIYDECGDDLIDYYDDLGMEIDEDDLEDMLEDCQDTCDGWEDYETYLECVNEAYEEVGADDCVADTGFNTSCADCQAGLDCGDLVEGDYGDCEDACETDYDPDDCADAMADLDAEDYEDLVNALDDCWSDYE